MGVGEIRMKSKLLFVLFVACVSPFILTGYVVGFVCQSFYAGS
jgi:hypothetical protein